MKLKLLTLFCIMTVVLSACGDSPVYNTNYYANVKTEFYTLQPNNWIAVPNNSYQWFQEFTLPQSGFSDFDNVGVMCYYLNQEEAWEALPSTRIFWTDDGVVYSDELWFSHNMNYLYIDYRNTIPGVASPPKDKLLVKAVYFDNNFYRSKAYKDIDWNNYEDVKSQLNLKD